MKKIDFDAFFKLTMERIKERYAYIIMLTIITIFFSVFYKEIILKESFTFNKAEAQDVLSDTITQDINIEYNKPQYISLKAGSHKSGVPANYKISILQDNESIASIDVNTSTLGAEEQLSFVLPELDNIKGESLKMQIVSEDKNVTEENSLIIYTSDNADIGMTINGDESSKTVYTTVAYHKYSTLYFTVIALVYFAGCILVLSINTRKIHNGVCAAILVLGTFCVVLNPVLDVPDDHAHLARADLTSRGILFVTKDASEYEVTNSVADILNDDFSTLETTSLINSPIDNTAESSFNNYANTNIFLGYIPQAIGIIIAKTLGKLLGANSLILLMLGRMMNLIVYALMVRLALKITPVLKIPMSIIALMPMSIFIASSFNPDATTYWMTMVLIAYFLYIYNKENINTKDIAIFAGLSILLGLVKLPYSALGALIIFIPKEKFEKPKTYYKSFLFVVLIAVVCLGWGLSAMLNSSGSSSSFESFYAANNIDTKGQISYIISHPTTFIKNFAKSLMSNSRNYMDQLNIFGWLSYGLAPGISQFYLIFIGTVILLYPNEYVLARKTKYGVILTGATVYAVTCLILYLSWTAVGSTGIEGVQGRYFVPLLALLSSLSAGRVIEDEERNHSINTRFIITAIFFAAIFIITMMNKYY